MTDAPPEALVRPRVEAAERILGRARPVLDDGFVRVIDYMGKHFRMTNIRAGRARPGWCAST
jgi:hypothetical protein